MDMPIHASMQRAALLNQLQDEPDAAGKADERDKGGVGIAPYLALAGGQWADAITTLMALQRPGARETNPMGGAGVLAAKAALTPAMVLLMKKLAASGYPTAAKIMGYVGGAAGAVPAAWNIGQMQK